MDGLWYLRGATEVEKTNFGDVRDFDVSSLVVEFDFYSYLLYVYGSSYVRVVIGIKYKLTEIFCL